jgi:hypothetical protein
MFALGQKCTGRLMHEVHTHVIGVPEVCCIEGWLQVLHI